MDVLQAGIAAIVLLTMIPLPTEMTQGTPFVDIPVTHPTYRNAVLHRNVVPHPLLFGLLKRFLDVRPMCPLPRRERRHGSVGLCGVVVGR